MPVSHAARPVPRSRRSRWTRCADRGG